MKKALLLRNNIKANQRNFHYIDRWAVNRMVSDGDLLHSDTYYCNLLDNLISHTYHDIDLAHLPIDIKGCIKYKMSVAGGTYNGSKIIKEIGRVERLLVLLKPMRQGHQTIHNDCLYIKYDLRHLFLPYVSFLGLQFPSNLDKIFNDVVDEKWYTIIYYKDMHHKPISQKKLLFDLASDINFYAFIMKDPNSSKDIMECETSKKDEALVFVNDILIRFLHQIGVFDEFGHYTKKANRLLDSKELKMITRGLYFRKLFRYRTYIPLNIIIDKIISNLKYINGWITNESGIALATNLCDLEPYKAFLHHKKDSDCEVNIKGIAYDTYSPTTYAVMVLYLLSLIMGCKSMKPTEDVIKRFTNLDYQLTDSSIKHIR